MLEVGKGSSFPGIVTSWHACALDNRMGGLCLVETEVRKLDREHTGPFAEMNEKAILTGNRNGNMP